MTEQGSVHRRRVLGAAVAACGPVRASSPRVVHYLPAEVPGDQRHTYPVKLLTLALARAGGRFEVRAGAQPMSKTRGFVELASGRPGLDVLWAVSDPERERQLLPIRIPMDRGLIGWRVLLVRREQAERLRDITHLDQLKPLVAGQGHDWIDLRILRANGLRVTPVNQYAALFRMLERGRIDYVPRGVTELARERELHDRAGLVVDPYLALHYPSAAYFFVNPQQGELAEAIRQGLEAAHRDGSFERLFRGTYQVQVEAARLGKRRVLELANPYLPPGAPLERTDMWWRPRAER